MSVVSLEKLFQQEIPRPFLSALVAGCPAVFKRAYEFVYQNFHEPQARDLLPHVRRSMMEQHLWTTASRFLDHDIDVVDNPNFARNCYHVEVRCGSIILTASGVSTPKQMVRDAKFRNTLAEDNQGLLFSYMDDRKRGDAYYAIILYGPDFEDRSKVAFIQLAFPSHDPEAKAYLGNSPYDLVSYCDATLYTKTEEEIVEDGAAARLRRQVKVQGD